MKNLPVILLLVIITSCHSKSDKQEKVIDTKVSIPKEIVKLDTVNQIARIDKNSIKDTTIDVLEYFEEKELPQIYRLGGVAYQPYMLDGKLVKIELDFDGDRETLTESYYFNETSEVFYISRVYSVYDPPKWEDGTKVVSEKKVEYFISGNTLRKSVGDSLFISFEVLESINKVLALSKEV